MYFKFYRKIPNSFRVIVIFIRARRLTVLRAALRRKRRLLAPSLIRTGWRLFSLTIVNRYNYLTFNVYFFLLLRYCTS